MFVQKNQIHICSKTDENFYFLTSPFPGLVSGFEAFRENYDNKNIVKRQVLFYFFVQWERAISLNAEAVQKYRTR